MKTRAPRRKVLIRTRMRVGAAWSDACILDISGRGMMIQAASPVPARGTYVELRRGARIIIGRVIWAKNRRFGLATQDPLDVEAIIAAPDGKEAPPACSPATIAAFDRRSAIRRHAATFERSRQWSRALEFLCIAAFGIGASTMVVIAVGQMFAAPLAALDRGFAAG